MRKKFNCCTSRGLNFIETVYELFDNPSYTTKAPMDIYYRYM